MSAAQRVIISGAGGLVGRALVAQLQSQGWRVDALVRRAPRAGTTEWQWDPYADALDPAAFEEAAGVIHLSGENIAGGAWTAARKQAILESRVASTRLLVKTMLKTQRRPPAFVCASAIGYFGDRGDETLTEASRPGTGFLSEVCQAWEAECAPLRDVGVRVVHVRIGIVLSPEGGALEKMLPPFRFGLGGVIGSGRQWMSWIARRDLVRVLIAALADGRLSGPVHAVAPQPVTNREFVQTLGRVLKRPAIVPLPAFAVRLIFGEMGQACLLAGQRVLPEKLLAQGFVFDLPNLEIALRAELNQP